MPTDPRKLSEHDPSGDLYQGAMYTAVQVIGCQGFFNLRLVLMKEGIGQGLKALTARATSAGGPWADILRPCSVAGGTSPGVAAHRDAACTLALHVCFTWVCR